MARDARREAPTYQTFVNAWNTRCCNIKLRESMRFTLCDLCVHARETLDRERVQGGHGWKSEEMIVIKRGLDDHYEASVPSRADCVSPKRCCLSAEHERVADMKCVPCAFPVCTMPFRKSFG